MPTVVDGQILYAALWNTQDARLAVLEGGGGGGTTYVPWVDVRSFGAIGDGIANDTTALHLARDSGAKHVYVPAGMYLTTLVLNVAGQTWELAPGTTIKAAANLAESGAAATLSANDVSIIGTGSIDGNRANQSGTNVFAVRATGDRCRIDGPSILGSKSIGLYISGGTGHTVRNVHTQNTFNNGVYVETSGKHMDDCLFENIVCDRTIETTGYQQGGFKLIGGATYKIRKAVIRNVRGILPSPTVAEGVSANGNVGVEMWYLEQCHIDDVYAYGGWIGVSFGFACKRNTIGKTYGENCRSNGFELAGSGSLGESNAFGQIVVNGSGITRRPVALTQFNKTAIDSINIIDGGVDDGANLSALVYVDTCNGLTIANVVGYMGTANGTGEGVDIRSSTQVDIGKMIVKSGTATTLGRGIRLESSRDVSVGGGSSTSFTNDVAVEASGSATVDNVSFRDFRFSVGAVTVSFPGGTTEGANIRFLGCPGLVRNGKACDILDHKNDVIHAWGTGSPESVVTANVGSQYMRTNGGAGTSWYVKETGTGNTGWVGK